MHTPDDPFTWEQLRRSLPAEDVARLRERVLEEHRSGLFTDADLAARYHMSERTLYRTLNRYRHAQTRDDYRTTSSAPKHPHRKYTAEDVQRLHELRAEDEARIEKNVRSSSGNWTVRGSVLLRQSGRDS